MQLAVVRGYTRWNYRWEQALADIAHALNMDRQEYCDALRVDPKALAKEINI